MVVWFLANKARRVKSTFTKIASPTLTKFVWTTRFGVPRPESRTGRRASSEGAEQHSEGPYSDNLLYLQVCFATMSDTEVFSVARQMSGAKWLQVG